MCFPFRVKLKRSLTCSWWRGFLPLPRASVLCPVGRRCSSWSGKTSFLIFFPLLPAEKFLYIITSREVFVLCSSFFWDKPVSQTHHPVTLPFSHFETQLVCLFWSRLQVSQLEIEINIVMFSFPAVSCFWLWRHLWYIHLTLFSPNHVQHLEYIQIRILPVSLLSFCSPYWNLPIERRKFFRFSKKI